MKKLHFMTIFIVLIIIFGSCKKEEPTSEEIANEALSQGWEKFETGDYNAALANFEEAVNNNSNLIDAYSGLGWTNAKLDEMEEAEELFFEGFQKDTSYVDIVAGLAFVRNAQKYYSSSNNWAQSALYNMNHWYFPHDNSLDYKDVHLLMSENYFALADFESSLLQVQELVSFTTDVSTQEGITELGLKIEELKSII